MMITPRHPSVRALGLALAASCSIAVVSGCSGDDNPPSGSISVPKGTKAEPGAANPAKKGGAAKVEGGVKERIGVEK